MEFIIKDFHLTHFKLMTQFVSKKNFGLFNCFLSKFRNFPAYCKSHTQLLFDLNLRFSHFQLLKSIKMVEVSFILTTAKMIRQLSRNTPTFQYYIDKHRGVKAFMVCEVFPFHSIKMFMSFVCHPSLPIQLNR